MEYTPAIVRTIRKNARTVPAAELAHAIGWTEGRLRRIAAHHAITLAEPPEPVAVLAPNEIEPLWCRLRIHHATTARLQAGAAVARLSLPRFIAQVLEGAAASRDLVALAGAAPLVERAPLRRRSKS
jgi:hypothetical protein